MDFGFSEEQELLRATAREVLARTCPPGWARTALEGGDEPTGLWREMAALGWLGIGIPEEDGGGGGGFIEQVVVLEELGRVLGPGSYVATTTAAAAVRALGDTAQRQALLPRLLGGGARGAMAVASGWADSPGPCPVRLRDDGLHGTVHDVPGAGGADLLLVPAVTEDGVVVAPVDTRAPGVRVGGMRYFDATRGVDTVSFEGARINDAGVLGGGTVPWERLQPLLDRAAVAACAELCGAASRVLEMTVAYAGQRVQFDRPIGSFQAVKHMCAEMLVRAEAARAAVHYAALCIDEARDDAAVAAAVAKAYAGEAVALLAEDAVQVHGGIGYTWEHDIHLYVRRAKATEQLFGSTDAHRDRIARLVGVC